MMATDPIVSMRLGAPALPARGLHPRHKGRSVLVKIETHRADAGGNVQAFVAFDTDRLQRDRVFEPAEQRIGARTYTDCRAHGNAAITTFECALLHV